MLNKQMIYYISHPYTSHGVPEQNLINAIKAELHIRSKHDVPTVNPILILPKGLSDEVAMEKCYHFLKSCDAIIMCPEWKLSKGCVQEHRWALDDKIPVYEFDGKNIFISATTE